MPNTSPRPRADRRARRRAGRRAADGLRQRIASLLGGRDVDHLDLIGGGPHNHSNAIADIAGGRMDGFIRERQTAHRACANPTDPACAQGRSADVMGYHTGAEIPNYWAYAKDFTLDDHMFEPVTAWSLVDHLDLVSA